MGQPVIPLRGRPVVSNWRKPPTDVWRVTDSTSDGIKGKAVLISDASREIPQDAAFYVSTSESVVGPGPTLHLPAQLAHIAPNDVIVVSDDGLNVAVAWKNSAVHNSLLLTERCDHYCLMCSQPPKERDDSFLYARAQRIITALPLSARGVVLSGGEPTIDPEAFFSLLTHIGLVRPDLSTHILSNGRRFADHAFTRRYAEVVINDLMVGIPIYAAETQRHDYIVQAKGAFNETIKGILNLGAYGCRVEVRVVLQKETIPVLTEIAAYIARNIPFVEQVALMGLEMTGLAKPNNELVWIDPTEYHRELRSAYEILVGSKITTRIYNHQLCVTDRELWPAAVQSISDWKNDFPTLCDPCLVKDQCAGVFTTSGSRISPNLRPILSL